MSFAGAARRPTRRLGHRRCPSRGSDPRRSSRSSRAPRRGRVDHDGPRRRPIGSFLPLLEPREQHALAALGPFEPRGDQRRPAPAQPVQRHCWTSTRLRARVQFGLVEQRPAAPRQSLQSEPRRPPRRRRIEPERAAQARRRRHREPRRMDEGEQLEQVEARQVRDSRAAARPAAR